MAYKQKSPVPILEGGTNTVSFANAFGIAYYDGASLNNITPGTSGEVLTSNGISSPASFQAISASGAITSVTGNSGSATPSSGVLTITGDGTIVSTSGSTSTLSLTSTAARTIATSSGTATASSNSFTLTGAGDIATSATGSTVTLTGSGATSLVTGSGTATVSTNSFTIAGGTGITTSASGSTVTITASASGGFTWNNVTGSTQTMAVGNGYVNNGSGSPTVYTLPSTASVGQMVAVQGANANGWQISQNTGQTIAFNGVTSTSGTGTVSSTSQFDVVYIICVTANTGWAINSSMGNLSVV